MKKSMMDSYSGRKLQYSKKDLTIDVFHQFISKNIFLKLHSYSHQFS